MSTDRIANLKAEQKKLEAILESSAGESKKDYASEELEKVKRELKTLTRKAQ